MPLVGQTGSRQGLDRDRERLESIWRGFRHGHADGFWIMCELSVQKPAADVCLRSAGITELTGKRCDDDHLQTMTPDT